MVTPELAAEHAITIMPIPVRFGTTEYQEGVDLTPEEFFDLLETSPEHPATSSPNPEQFKQAYKRLSADGGAIVSMHILAEQSGTVTSARRAATELGNPEIHVLELPTAAMGLGLLALEAAQAAESGADAGTIKGLTQELLPRTFVIFLLPTLEYLHRGGRIGGAQAFLGSLLKVKPVVAVKDGLAAPVTRVRSLSKAHTAMARYVREHAPNGLQCAAVLHGDAEEHRRRLEDLVLGEFPPSARMYPDIPIGPVVGSHTGRGSFGLAFIANP